MCTCIILPVNYVCKVIEEILVVFLVGVAFVIAMVITPYAMSYARAHGIVDRPDENLKNHKTAIPYLGGVVVGLITLASIFLLLRSWAPASLLHFLGLGSLLLTGFLDDIRLWTPKVKLLCQLGGVVLLTGALLLYHDTSMLSLWELVLASLAAIFILCGAVNAVNLVDVMDGLASSLVITSMLGHLAIVGAFYPYEGVIGSYPHLIIAPVLIGALLGFLFYNVRPARIYLGDAGAFFLGGFIGFEILLLSSRVIANGHIDWAYYPFFFTPLMLMGGEVAALIVIRTFKGLPVYLGSRHHFSHYLQDKKWSWWRIASFANAVNTLASFVGYIVLTKHLSCVAGYLALTLLVLGWVSVVYVSTKPWRSLIS